MLGNEAQAASTQIVLSAVSAANTAAATSAWLDVRRFEGDVQVLINLGAVTGTFTPTLEDATDGTGTGGAGFTPNEGALGAQTQNSVRKLTFKASSSRGFVRLVGTIGTGPSLVSAVLQGRPKNF